MKKPVNEMGVVALFSQYAQGLGYVIMEIQAPFPDATLYKIETGEMVRAEFEYLSVNFKRHGHDPAGCDLIICWQDNWKECPLPVIELCDVHGQEPAETIYDLTEKAKRLQRNTDIVQREYVAKRNAISEVQTLRDELALTREEVSNLKRKFTAINQLTREKIREELSHDGVASVGLKIGAYNRKYRKTGLFYCKHCGSSLAVVYQSGKHNFILVNGILIEAGSFLCDDCGAETTFSYSPS